jgi:hypothetical protein
MNLGAIIFTLLVAGDILYTRTRCYRVPCVLTGIYPPNLKCQKIINKIAKPKKQPKKIMAILKNGPKKFFHKPAAVSGLIPDLRSISPALRRSVKDVPQ